MDDEFAEFDTPATEIIAAIDAGEPVVFNDGLRITYSTFPVYGETATSGGGSLIVTTPGFSDRSSESVTTQFAQRDERMSEMEQEAGWSNSAAAKDAPEDVHPDVTPLEEREPGYSNAKAVKGAESSDAAAAESKVVDDASTEDKSVQPAKKAAAKKTAKKG